MADNTEDTKNENINDEQVAEASTEDKAQDTSSEVVANEQEGLNNDELDALNDVAKAAQDVADSVNTSKGGIVSGDSPTLDYILDVTLQISVEVGRARMSIQDLLQLGQGAVVELEKIAGEPLDIYMNGKQVAKGEAVIVNERFGVRITDVISREERVLGLK